MTDKTEITTEKVEEKMHDEQPYYNPVGGAVSLDGAFEFLQARKHRREIDELVHLFEQVSGNIMRSEESDLTAKAGQMEALAGELATEVEQMSKKRNPLKALQELLTADKQGAGFDKSAWNGSPSAFSTTEAYCKSCLIDVNPAGAEKKQSHCKLPLKKEGSSKPNINALRTMASGRGIPAVKKPAGVDATKFAAKKKSAASRIAGLWPKAFGNPAPASILRLAGKSLPVDKSFVLTRNKATNQLEWWGIVSNNFRDREDEILTQKAHQEFANFYKGQYKVPLRLWHTPRADVGEVSWVAEINGFLVKGGFIYPECEVIVEKAVAENWDAMSHGFIPLAVDQELRLIKQYRIFEVSLLPSKVAANPWTSLQLIQEKHVMNGTKRQELEQILGPEIVQALEGETGDLRQILESEGVESKEIDPEPEASVEAAEVDADVVKELVKALAKPLAESLDFKGLNDYLAKLHNSMVELRSDMKALKQNDETKLDEKVSSLFDEPFLWQQVKAASQDNGNVIDPESKEDAALVAKPPKASEAEDDEVFKLFFEDI